MGLELPVVSAGVARMQDPTITLAAYGGVVFPLALLIESPVLMLLSASTALSRDAASYAVGRRFMYALGGGFTALHALVAFTPLFDLVARGILRVPEPVVEPARLGFRVMTPWTIAIAYRRFQQGLLIRFGRSRAVGVGTAIRLCTNLSVVVAGVVLQTVPGIVIAALAVTSSVVAEAAYAGFAARPVRNGALRAAAPVEPPLTPAGFLRFYLPLMITPLFVFLTMPFATAAMSRMPRPIESLATWPVVHGLMFALRSGGFAATEVVVAMLDRPGALPVLRRFIQRLSIALTAVVVVFAATPVAHLWFARVSALPLALVPLATAAVWIAVPFPAISAWQSLMQGAIVHSRRTRGITESVVLMIVVVGLVLALAVAVPFAAGVHAAMLAMVVGNVAMLAWLSRRARQARPATVAA